MKHERLLTRRAMLQIAAAAPLAAAGSKGRPPVGLELYSVRDQLKADLFGTVKTVAKMGYQGVEFYSPYYDWTPAYAKDVRKLLDDLGIRCFSTHNSAKVYETDDNLKRGIELNQAIGSKFIVQASAGRVAGLDGWKVVAERLAKGSETLKNAGMRAGYHNHAAEFKAIDGTLPLEVIAKNTPKQVALQLDVGTALEMGMDPVKWIEQHSGRIASMHLKDWAPEPKGYKVLFGEGNGDWKKIFKAAEKTGGVEYYLIEQEGSAFPPVETAEKCLATFRKVRG